MKRQTTLFSSAPKRSRTESLVLPPGAKLIEDFISSKEEAELLANVDRGVWNTTLKRRTQHYGIEYDYKAKWVAGADKSTRAPLTPLPEWCTFVIDRLLERKLITTAPIQLLVNEYEPGQGISRHSDSPAFGDTVISLSLSSPCIMQLRRADQCIDVPLARRSLLVLSGESRWKWTHEIAGRKSDIIEGERVPRTRRVSLTFRWLREQPQDSSSSSGGAALPAAALVPLKAVAEGASRATEENAATNSEKDK